MIFEKLGKLVTESGFVQIFTSPDGWKALVMIVIACVLLYLGIKKQYEPLLMVGIAVGCLLANVSVLGGVENALYHGIKNKRGGGKIFVRVKRQNRVMTFTVADTGKGMAPEQIREVETMLKEGTPTVQAALEPGHSGFGMRNVDMRIRLYYKKKTGLMIQSGPEGTEVSFSIPIRTREEIDHDESLSRG